MKITVRNTLVIAAIDAQLARLAALRDEAEGIRTNHRRDDKRPCREGICQAELRLKNFIQTVDVKRVFLDAELRRFSAKLWPWSRITTGVWSVLVCDTSIETAVLVGEPEVAEPSFQIQAN